MTSACVEVLASVCCAKVNIKGRGEVAHEVNYLDAWWEAVKTRVGNNCYGERSLREKGGCCGINPRQVKQVKQDLVRKMRHGCVDRWRRGAVLSSVSMWKWNMYSCEVVVNVIVTS